MRVGVDSEVSDDNFSWQTHLNSRFLVDSSRLFVNPEFQTTVKQTLRDFVDELSTDSLETLWTPDRLDHWTKHASESEQLHVRVDYLYGVLSSVNRQAELHPKIQKMHSRSGLARMPACCHHPNCLFMWNA